jgi:hypothetical protein
MAWKKRIGKICHQNPRKQDVTTILILESCLSARGNESRDAGVADKYLRFRFYQTLVRLKQFTMNFKNRFREGRYEVLSNQPDRLN